MLKSGAEKPPYFGVKLSCRCLSRCPSIGVAEGGGKLQPVLDTVLAPQQVGAALQKLATQEVVGKSIMLFDKL